MFHFFTEKTSISDEKVLLTPEDYNHAVNVLRMRKGEKIMISDEEGRDYYCTVQGVVPEEMALRIHMDDVAAVNHELPARISLYQSLPKSDKFEWILQKATELGVTDIYPVESKNCVVKVGKEKSEKKTERWQKIAEAAAKQSKRSVIPEVHDILPFTEAVRRVSEEQGVSIIPYEEENGMAGTCEAILRFLPGTDISVFIGPEGGYSPLEIKYAKDHGITPVSLGKRILRTETAALAVLSLIMIRLEIAQEMDFS